MEAIRREAVSLVESTDSSLGESDLDRRTSSTISVEPVDVGRTPPTTGVSETGDRDDNDSADTVKAHKCDVCSMTFESKSGLGQNIRHRHPNFANELRQKAVLKDTERKRDRLKRRSKAYPSPHPAKAAGPTRRCVVSLNSKSSSRVSST